jgi:hypothetical protein
MSWLPGAGRGYIGLNVGRSRFHADCGVSDFLSNTDCGRRDTMLHGYAGSMIGTFWGAELGYVDMGNISRGGGTTRARGVNLSAVGKFPIAAGFGAFGKVGTTFGRTRTSSEFGSGVTEGTREGFGLSYGVGVSYDFNERVSAVLAWDSHDFRFAGGGRDPIRVTSLGVQYRY